MFWDYDIFCRVRASPKQYLGDDTIGAYQAFGAGYNLIPKNDMVWLDFDAWIHRRTGIFPGIHNARSVLQLTCSDDRDALQAYFREVDACLAASEHARDPSKWPHPPHVRTTIPSKRVHLDTIKHRPALYFESKSAGHLWAFFSGHDCSIADLGQEPDPLNMLDFERWLGEKMEFPNVYRWDRVLEFLSMGNRDRAFDLFFDFIRQYLDEKDDPWIEETP